jgi:acyl carrier protein
VFFAAAACAAVGSIEFLFRFTVLFVSASPYGGHLGGDSGYGRPEFPSPRADLGSHGMNDTAIRAPEASLASPISVEAILEVVSALYSELHRAEPAPEVVSLNSHLERDLGLDSLGRMELVLRLEVRFGLHLPDTTISSAETVGDLVALVTAAAGAVDAHRGTPAVLVNPVAAPRPRLGTPNAATTLNEVLAWHAEHHPDATHTIVLDGQQSRPVTYAQLRDGAQSVAASMQRAGVQSGTTVVLMLPTAVEYLYAFFGVLLAGAVPVPIYPPTRPSQIEEHVHRHAGVLTNAAAEALITVPEARAVAHFLRARVPSLRHIWSVAELTQGEHFQPLRNPPSAESTAMLQYTSGSTGSPKGVVLTHANLLANIRTIGKVINATESDVFVSWLPLYHDMGLIGAWLGSLYFGCLLVIMPPTAFLARPARWLQAIHHYRGTLTASPNFGYELCARRVADQDLAGLDLSSLRIAFNGAEPIYPDTLERFCQRFSPWGFRPEAMTPVYGLAEAAVGLTIPPIGRGPIVDFVDRTHMTGESRAEARPAGAPNTLRFVSCGRPLPAYRVRIVDGTGLEVPERVEGTLQFTGPSATAGYFHNAEATARLLSGEWRDTGDRAYMAAGELYITGRVKDIIIRRGRHIYPDEIESAVAELDGVRKGCVVAFGTKAPSTATEKLVVLAETRLTDPTSRAQLKARITECVVDCVGEPPEEVMLAVPHAILKTSSGKLRRAATCAAYEDHTLGRAPARPTVQLLRLAIEGAAAPLRRARESVAQVAYGLYAWVVALVIGVPGMLRIALCREQARAWRLNHLAARWLVAAWRIPFSVKSETDVDMPVPHVVVVNHCSYLDSIFVAALLPSPHIVVAKAGLLRVPVLRIYLRKLGIIFVERSAPEQRLLEVERMKAALGRGLSVIIFPEGTFTAETGLRPFHLGAFEIAVATGAPIIPITLHGTRSVLRDGQWLPRRLPVSAVIGAPLTRSAGEDAFAAAVHLRDAARAQVLRHCGEPDLL